MSETVLRRAEGVMEARLSDDELVLLGSQAEDYVGLDAIAADVWERLETPMSLEELVEGLARDYEAPPETIAADLGPALDTLLETGLLVREPRP